MTQEHRDALQRSVQAHHTVRRRVSEEAARLAAEMEALRAAQLAVDQERNPSGTQETTNG